MKSFCLVILIRSMGSGSLLACLSACQACFCTAQLSLLWLGLGLGMSFSLFLFLLSLQVCSLGSDSFELR